MEKSAQRVIWACAVIASMCASNVTFAQGGGNGNGGSGGGGAHGAATSGMTYHGEPVTSAWAADPGQLKKSVGMAGTAMRIMSPDDGAMPAKSGQ